MRPPFLGKQRHPVDYDTLLEGWRLDETDFTSNALGIKGLTTLVETGAVLETVTSLFDSQMSSLGAADFNAHSAYLQKSAIAGAELTSYNALASTGMWTLSAWININNFPGVAYTQHIFSFGDNAGNGMPFSWTVHNDGHIYFTFKDTGGTTRNKDSGLILTAGVTYFVALSRGGPSATGKATFYVIDTTTGAMTSAVASSWETQSSAATAPRLCLGQHHGNAPTSFTQFFGTIDDFMIWSSCLSSYDLSEIYRNARILKRSAYVEAPTAQTALLYRMDNGSTTGLLDATTRYNLTSTTTPTDVVNVSQHPLAQIASQGAKNFNGSTQYYNATISGAALTYLESVLCPHVSGAGFCIGTAFYTASISTSRVIIQWGASGSDLAAKLSINSSGHPVYSFKDTIAGQLDYTFSNITLAINTYYYLLFSFAYGADLVFPNAAGNSTMTCSVISAAGTIQTDVQYLYSSVKPVASTSNKVLAVGAAVGGGGSFFSGTIYEIAIWDAPAKTETFNYYANKLLSQVDEMSLYRGSSSGVRLKVWVENADKSVVYELTSLGPQSLNFLQSCEISHHIDNGTDGASVTLAREIYGFRLNPLNPTEDSLGITLGLMRRVRIDVALSAEGEIPPAWAFTNLFTGYIEKIEFAQEEMVLTLKDVLKPFEKTMMFAEYEVTVTTPVETVLQNLLDVTAPSSGYFCEAVDTLLWIRDDPGVDITVTGSSTEVLFTRKNHITALNDIAFSYGGTIKGVFDPVAGYFRPAHIIPSRNPTALQMEIQAEDYLDVTQASLSLEGIVNKVDVVYALSATSTNHDGTPAPQTLTISDSTSIASYGESNAQIQHNLIDTVDKATVLGDAILSDLSQPDTIIEVEGFFRRFVGLGDYYRFNANQVHTADDINLAVVGYTHSFSANGAQRTKMSLRGKPASSFRGWHRGLVRGGQPRPISILETMPSAPASPVLYSPFAKVVEVRWTVKTLTTEIHIEFQVHMSTTNDFTPSSATLQGVVRGNQMVITHGLSSGTTYYFKIIAVGYNGLQSAASVQTSIVCT